MHKWLMYLRKEESCEWLDHEDWGRDFKDEVVKVWESVGHKQEFGYYSSVREGTGELEISMK